MAKPATAMLTCEDLKKRWRKKDVSMIYIYAKRYRDILQPVKIGKHLLFEPENVKKFEKNMRVMK